MFGGVWLMFDLFVLALEGKVEGTGRQGLFSMYGAPGFCSTSPDFDDLLLQLTASKLKSLRLM
jgi:hypothetical protein